jgi:hypothetical protein
MERKGKERKGFYLGVSKSTPVTQWNTTSIKAAAAALQLHARPCKSKIELYS